MTNPPSLTPWPKPPVSAPPPTGRSWMETADMVLSHVITKCVGLGVAGFFGRLTYLEVEKAAPLSNVPLYVFSCLAMFGLALALGDPMIAVLRSVLGAVGPYLPKRHDDGH